MKLKGKAKEDFDKWYESKDWIAYGIITSGVFNVMPESMQWGVYVDFFDSVGFGIAARKESNKYIWFVGKTERDFYINTKESLSEARAAAIEKANEIYNK